MAMESIMDNFNMDMNMTRAKYEELIIAKAKYGSLVECLKMYVEADKILDRYDLQMILAALGVRVQIVEEEMKLHADNSCEEKTSNTEG